MIPIPASQSAAPRTRTDRDEVAATQAFAELWAPRWLDLARHVRGKRGRAAVEAFAAIEAAADALHREIRKTLKGPRQTRVFDHLVTPHRQAEFHRLRHHAILHERLWRDETSEAILRRQVAIAAELGADPRAFDDALKPGLAEIDSYAGQAGHRQATVSFRKRRFQSQAVLAALHHIPDPLTAAAFYFRNRDLVVAERRAEVEASRGLAQNAIP
jgi:hypothetical protein